MGRMIKKWGETALVALCVLTIVFAALYTRQDDLRRMAAQNAAASRDERLQDAQPPRWQRPVDSAPAQPYIGARRTESGLWSFSPWVRYDASFSRRVCAMANGTVTRAEGNAVWVRHAEGVETRYRNLSSLAVQAGQRVEAGQTLGTAEASGVEVAALRDGAFIDPESLLPREEAAGRRFLSGIL